MNRMQRWRERKRQEGMIEVRVTVPANERDTILAVAEWLRPRPVTFDEETAEPDPVDRPPSAKFLAFAERVAERNGIEIPAPIKRSNNRLCGWVNRNRCQWNWVDQVAETRRQRRIAQLRAELERLK